MQHGVSAATAIPCEMLHLPWPAFRFCAVAPQVVLAAVFLPDLQAVVADAALIFWADGVSLLLRIWRLQGVEIRVIEVRLALLT